MKIFALLTVIAGIAFWAYRDRLRPAPAPGVADTGIPPAIQRLTDDEYKRQVHENTALRVSLSKKYPEVYQDLAKQAKRNLRECIVTEVVPGMLKATCR